MSVILNVCDVESRRIVKDLRECVNGSPTNVSDTSNQTKKLSEGRRCKQEKGSQNFLHFQSSQLANMTDKIERREGPVRCTWYLGTQEKSPHTHELPRSEQKTGTLIHVLQIFQSILRSISLLNSLLLFGLFVSV